MLGVAGWIAGLNCDGWCDVSDDVFQKWFVCVCICVCGWRGDV